MSGINVRSRILAAQEPEDFNTLQNTEGEETEGLTDAGYKPCNADGPFHWFEEILSGYLGKAYIASVIAVSGAVVYTSYEIELQIYNILFLLILFNWLLIHIFHNTRVLFIAPKKILELDVAIVIPGSHDHQDHGVAIDSVSKSFTFVNNKKIIFSDGAFPDDHEDVNQSVLPESQADPVATVSVETVATAHHQDIEITDDDDDDDEPLSEDTTTLNMHIATTMILIIGMIYVIFGRRRLRELRMVIEDEIKDEFILYEMSQG
ncbi:hypothetical protein ACJJTC_006499 [Scirpophaga incertulas]